MTAEHWLEQLHDHGYPITAARRAVVDTIFGATHALTPIQVYDAARKKYRALGLVTVYRTLEKLEMMLEKALHKPKARKATKPTYLSKVKKRETKARRSDVKQGRKRVSWD